MDREHKIATCKHGNFIEECKKCEDEYERRMEIIKLHRVIYQVSQDEKSDTNHPV